MSDQLTDFGLFWRARQPHAPASAGRRRAPFLLRLLPGLGACGLAGLLVAGLLDRREVDPPAPPAADPIWVDAGAPLFGLVGAGSSGALRSEAQRRSAGPGRIDVLTLGEGPGGDWLRVALQQAGPQDPPSGSLFLDLSRAAARAGLAVTRSALPAVLTTRFGDFELAEIELAEGEGARACLGLRLLAGEPDLRIVGFACAREGRPSPAALACQLDGLQLLAPDAEAGLARFFAAAELASGSACIARQVEARPRR